MITKKMLLIVAFTGATLQGMEKQTETLVPIESEKSSLQEPFILNLPEELTQEIIGREIFYVIKDAPNLATIIRSVTTLKLISKGFSRCLANFLAKNPTFDGANLERFVPSECTAQSKPDQALISLSKVICNYTLKADFDFFNLCIPRKVSNNYDWGCRH
jgi:hypothetical protein